MQGRKEDWKTRFYRFMLGSHPDDCWPWIGANTHETNGAYGIFSRNGRSNLAHRVAWEIHRGPIPEGLVLCHSCDKTLCCNHNHLFLGSMRDNCLDREAKGRGNRRGRTAALTPEQVDEIRHTDTGTRALAVKFGTTRGTVQRARYDKTYTGSAGEYRRKLTPEQVQDIRGRSNQGEPNRAIARLYGVSDSHIRAIVLRLIWKHIP